MAAPQQAQVPVYKETSNIPNTRVDSFMYDDRRSGGAALARLLGAIPGAAKRHQEIQDEGQGQHEQEQLAALAQMGAERDRLRLAEGESVFGLLRSNESSMDAYEINRARMDADLRAGEIRDAYAASGLSENDDPKAFAAFVEEQQAAIFAALEGSDPSYYHGYITRVAGVFEEMAKSHAGHLDGFIDHKRRRAMDSRIRGHLDQELRGNHNNNAYVGMMSNLMTGESGGNYNAFHNNGSNRAIRFTEMTLQQVMDWQKSGQWRQYGAESSAVGKYQFVGDTLAATVRASGLDPNTTQFTPEVQDQLSWVLLNNRPEGQRLTDFLEGTITAETFLNGTMANEWAALQRTDGTGRYDGVGSNRAGTSSRKSIDALNAFREAYRQEPGLVTQEDSKGRIVLAANREETVERDIENAEKDYGFSQKEARDAVVEQVIERLEQDPDLVDSERLDSIIQNSKLSKAQRKQVNDARKRIREKQERQQQAEYDRQETEAEDLMHRYLTTENLDEEALGDLLDRMPDVPGSPRDYLETLPQRLAENGPASGNEEFVEGADYDSPTLRRDAMRALVRGEIDRDTYKAVTEQAEAHRKAKPILRKPALRRPLRIVRTSLPESLREDFDLLLDAQIGELTEMAEAEGRKVTTEDVLARANTVSQALLNVHQTDVSSRLERPEYQ